MARKNNRSDWHVKELARDNPLTTTAVAAGAAAAGLLLWSKRHRIGDRLSGLSGQVGHWADSMRGGNGFEANGDRAGLTPAASIRTRAARRSSRRREAQSQPTG